MIVQYVEGGDLALFDGHKFRRDKRTGYYLSAKAHERLHRYIWRYYNGEIPDGYHIHHKDKDKTNNEIDNLECIPAFNHLSIHGYDRVNNHYDEVVKNLDNIRPAASAWHKSEEGRAWHKKHAQEMGRIGKPAQFVCANCGKPFVKIDMGKNKFCSDACRAAYRRKSGVDNETRICEWCGKPFEVNKYSKGRTCSRSCKNYLRWAEKRGA